MGFVLPQEVRARPQLRCPVLSRGQGLYAHDSDKLDAQVLAEFLALDMIPEAWRPTPRVRQHRALVRQRQYVRNRITSVKNKVRHILANYNADIPELFTPKGRTYLAELQLRRPRAARRIERPLCEVHR